MRNVGASFAMVLLVAAPTVPSDPRLSYRALTEISYGLPPGSGGEVMVALERPCMEPGMPSAGLVIDDLRVE